MKKFWIMLFLTLMSPNSGFTGTAADYLIMQDVGQYKFMGKGGGLGSGIIAATGHFSKDHTDESYGGMYFNEANEIGVNVEVTKHSGSDSDKWLLHEVEDGYRDPDMLEANLTEGTVLRLIDGNRVFNWGAGTYTWISGTNIVVRIEYTDLTGTKPEPLEVVKAYLRKFPSNITLTDAELRTKAHGEKWIKGEMERRLWLCDKWFYQLQLGKVQQNEVLQQAVKSMNVFLDYREKYYGIKAADEKSLLAGYLNTNNGTEIKAKLKEYKDWWTVNKDKAITLP